MPASYHHRAGSTISNNGGSIGLQQLPLGSCNYKDLNKGVQAPTCGCKRFWLNSAYGNGYGSNSTDKAWCFCGHHACFHSTFSQQQGLSQLSFGAVEGVTERVQPSAPHAQPEVTAEQPKPTGLGIQQPFSEPQRSVSMRLWNALNAFARNQEDGPASESTSKLPSTACPSVAGEPRASPSRTLREQMQSSRCMGPPVNIPHLEPAAGAGSEENSATEVATPSANGTPDLRAFTASALQPRSSPSNIPSGLHSRAAVPHAQSQDEVGPDRPQVTRLGRPAFQPAPAPTNVLMTTDDLRDLARTLGQRVDALENLSFSQLPAEEIQEKFDLIDVRLLDLEQWRGDSEHHQLDSQGAGLSSSRRRRLLPTESHSLSSDGSFDSVAAAHTEAAVLATLAANAETGPRIDGIESRLADLENVALPSFAQPWQVQVVLLPWGRGLRGIWFTTQEATQRSVKSSTQLSDEWPETTAAPKLSFKSTASGAWATESIEAWANETHEWLSPKACGPSGQVFQRLASRGLVQDVALTSSDSRHVLAAISEAFRHMLRLDKDAVVRDADYLGLRETFVPLRKVRKSARLRFLSAPEMVTSALWTAAFLDSSVCMKVNDGQRRLYLTTSDAYLQQNEGWSWQTLKQLPNYDAIGDEPAAQAESRSIGACWSYSDRLDQPNSAHTSFAASHANEWSNRSQRSALGSESEMPAQTGHKLPLSTKDVRLMQQRAVSLPSSSSPMEQEPANVPKRPDTVGTMSLIAWQPSPCASAKRRRLSTSSQGERHVAGFTPRWSRDPPSPYASQSQGTSSHKRGITPLAYATPHSNSHHASRLEFLGRDGDTEADTDMAVPQIDNADDEWQGVEDGLDSGARPNDCMSAMDEPEIDEGPYGEKDPYEA